MSKNNNIQYFFLAVAYVVHFFVGMTAHANLPKPKKIVDESRLDELSRNVEAQKALGNNPKTRAEFKRANLLSAEKAFTDYINSIPSWKAPYYSFNKDDAGTIIIDRILIKGASTLYDFGGVQIQANGSGESVIANTVLVPTINHMLGQGTSLTVGPEPENPSLASLVISKNAGALSTNITFQTQMSASILNKTVKLNTAELFLYLKSKYDLSHVVDLDKKGNDSWARTEVGLYNTIIKNGSTSYLFKKLSYENRIFFKTSSNGDFQYGMYGPIAIACNISFNAMLGDLSIDSVDIYDYMGNGIETIKSSVLKKNKIVVSY